MVLKSAYICGVPNTPTSVTVNDKGASFHYDSSTQVGSECSAWDIIIAYTGFVEVMLYNLVHYHQRRHHHLYS